MVRWKKLVLFAAFSPKVIKVGWSSDPIRRIKQMVIDVSPPDVDLSSGFLIKAVIGDSFTERSIHNKLQDYRVVGEWFRDCVPVRKLIKSLVGVNPIEIKAPIGPQPDWPNLNLSANALHLRKSWSRACCAPSQRKGRTRPVDLHKPALYAAAMRNPVKFSRPAGAIPSPWKRY